MKVESPFNLRRFKPDDLNRVIYINQICLPENYSSFFFMDLFQRFPETFIVAEKDEMIVGYIMCRIESGFSIFRSFGALKKGHVISIAVLPEYRNQGVGYALIQEALRAMSTSYDAKECYLEVRVSNTTAVNLYKKIGFEGERTVRGYYINGESAYVMVVKLPL